MENVGNALLTKALEYLQSAEAFAKSEVPLYLQELLRFKIAEHLVQYFDDIFVFGILLVVLILFYKKVVKKMPEDSRDDRDCKEFASGFCLLSTIPISIGLTVGICHTEPLVSAYKAYAAPRVYLVDYVKSSLSSKECSK